MSAEIEKGKRSSSIESENRSFVMSMSEKGIDSRFLGTPVRDEILGYRRMRDHSPEEAIEAIKFGMDKVKDSFIRQILTAGTRSEMVTLVANDILDMYRRLAGQELTKNERRALFTAFEKWLRSTDFYNDVVVKAALSLARPDSAMSLFELFTPDQLARFEQYLMVKLEPESLYTPPPEASGLVAKVLTPVLGKKTLNQIAARLSKQEDLVAGIRSVRNIFRKKGVSLVSGPEVSTEMHKPKKKNDEDSSHLFKMRVLHLAAVNPDSFRGMMPETKFKPERLAKIADTARGHFSTLVKFERWKQEVISFTEKSEKKKVGDNPQPKRDESVPFGGEFATDDQMDVAEELLRK